MFPFTYLLALLIKSELHFVNNESLRVKKKKKKLFNIPTITDVVFSFPCCGMSFPSLDLFPSCNPMF